MCYTIKFALVANKADCGQFVPALPIYQKTSEVGSRKTLKRVGYHLLLNIFFMKKYVFGIFAVLFALATVAFTHAPRLNKNFRLSVTPSSSGAVSQAHNWVETSDLTCDGGDVQACVITGVSEVYYHFDDELNAFILNNSSDNTATDDPISITPGGTGPYYVSSVSAGSYDNKQ